MASRWLAPLVLALCAGVSVQVSAPRVALAQGFVPDAKEPVEVIKPRGEFAKRLHGLQMPVGRGWKAFSDREKLFQVMLPDRWKIVPDPEGETALRAVPPGQDKEARAVLSVFFKTPADKDPLSVDEKFALNYVDEVADDNPSLKQLDFQPTDAGYVIARGQKFALAGGTLKIGSKKRQELFQMQQLVYISEDRIVSLQFVAPASDFPRYAEDLARIFASYQDVGIRKPQE